ncbi:hypothetical protein RHGRI_025928 [Rhododendron griersonianum]|uniref:DUF4220 domain-containing protein n=1 Tax=Rhododendron griersonianum TaxID=479676 RepID=A0AAV6IQU6_9ERIC|nr:hypothetical protein RHGRI_025928 [Rhododendron griersonianum]
MEQLSLLSFCFATRVKPLFGLKILKVLGIEEIAEIYVYKSITPPAQLCFGRFEDLPNEIFRKVKGLRSWAENNGQGTDLKSLFGRRGGMAINRYGGSDFEWSVEMEFHQSILIWHLATEICHRLDYISEPNPDSSTSYFHNRGKCMSQYMLYLLVEHPNMLPIGMGQIKFRDLYSDLGDFMEMYISKPLKDVTEKEASKMLMEVVNPENMLVGGGGRSNFVILHGSSQCKGRHHAQQLRRGGEYLTHLWLLMAHLGYTNNFQILRSRPIAGAVLRMRHRPSLSRVRGHPVTPQWRQLEGAGHGESSTRSSGSTAQNRRSEASGPSLTLGPYRAERPKARTRLDFDMNYPPLREKRAHSHLQPYGEESHGRHQETSRDMHRERDNSVVLFDQITGEPITYRPRLFADLILGFQDRDASRAIFESIDMDHHKALKVIEIELGLIYDVMYTKATIVYSSWGIAGRIIGSFLILGVLVMVSLDKAMVGKSSSKIDITMTLVLLVVALLLDSCAFGELILSDQTAHWLIKHKKTTTLRAINRIRTMIPTNWGRKRKRWSKTMEQLSLLSFCFATKVKPLFCLRILKVLGIEEVAEIYLYKRITPPAQLCFGRSEDLPNEIFRSVKGQRSWAENNGQGTDLKSLFGRRGGMTLNRHGRKDLEWSVEMEFHQSILIWHLATEIFYQLDYIAEPCRGPPPGNSTLPDFHYRAKCMSRYMLYLLVEHPNMLPIGMGQIKFRELYSGLGDFMEIYISKPLNPENMLVGGGGRSNFVILHGCKLASQLGKFEQEHKWKIIVNVWIEMMGHAASQCKGRHHAQQLRRGGEYLTHLWLLMAHFGYTDNFQVLRSRPIAGAVLR